MISKCKSLNHRKIKHSKSYRIWSCHFCGKCKQRAKVFTCNWLSEYLDFPLCSENDSTLTGNDMFEGFAKDLAEAMANKLRRKYRLREVATFGEKHKDTNQWDGLIGELVNRVSFPILRSFIHYSWRRIHSNLNCSARTWPFVI